MLNEEQIRKLVASHGADVNQGRPIRQLINDGELPRLAGCTVLEGKVSDSVFGDSLKTASGKTVRLMFRNNRISTHDVNRGAIPFKDQVLAFNHDHMHRLVKPILGSSQFEVDGLSPASTVIPAENLNLLKVENVLRLYMAESSTSTSLYQHWLAAKEQGQTTMNYAGHDLDDLEEVAGPRVPEARGGLRDHGQVAAEPAELRQLRGQVQRDLCFCFRTETWLCVPYM